MERLNPVSTVNYGPTVIYGGDDLFTVMVYCFTVEKLEPRCHRKLRSHRNLRWRYFFIYFVFHLKINCFPDIVRT
ncbi:hypothetical protein HanHA300_Chr04g0149601 [Helianthus annuus]|nr:hypothetical protein HanHA300_Chr04g0149601 [Helianthus annuus]KAJ0758815.1 hypothetical protein HanLR1_Chr04g0154571 [Helianthus annuus]